MTTLAQARPSDRAWLYLILVFIALNAVDLGLTYRLVDLGAVELNPIMAAALSAPDQATALTAWEDARVRFGRAVLQWGRDLGSYIGPPPPDDAARAKAAHYQKPEILLSVTAATDPYPYLNLGG